MIDLTQGDTLYDRSDLVIASPTGSYEDIDLILCATVDNPTFPICMFQAQYVRYGGQVYAVNTPQEKAEVIAAIDADIADDATTPDTTPDAVDSTPAPVVDTPPATTTPDTSTASTTPPIQPDTGSATSTDPLPDILNTGVSSTTPPVVVPPAASSTDATSTQQ